MNKVNPNDVAKWFCSQGIIENPNSREGNMKVQKLLFFAQLIYMAKNNGETMFDEEFKAFKDGVVLESVMTNYREHYKDMFKEIEKGKISVEPNLLEILDQIVEIFGDASAQELSELSHEFDAWNKFFQKSKKPGSYVKELSLIPYEELRKELYRIEKVLRAYEQVKMFPDDGVEDY